jgi:lipopolysaccharide heptosyltransferase I
MIQFPSPPARILIIKPSAIGDVVHTLPILNLLRKRFPAAHIAWMLTPACAGLLDGHPMLNEVVLFDRNRYARSWRDPASLMGLVTFMKELRRRKFSLVIDLQGLFRSGWFTWQTRAPRRVGFRNARELAPMFYTDAIDVGPPEQHAIDRYLKLAVALGCDTSEVAFPFHVTDEDRRHVDSHVGSIGRFAVLMPGTNWPTKRWPIEKFAQLVEPLEKRFAFKTVVAGGPDDIDRANQIGGTNLAGKTTLRQTVALLQRAALVIANDSGPMHIAAALGKPLVALYGPTNPVRTGPYQRDDAVLRLDIPCSPCYSRRCSHQSCLQWLEVESVLTQAESQLQHHARAGVSAGGG